MVNTHAPVVNLSVMMFIKDTDSTRPRKGGIWGVHRSPITDIPVPYFPYHYY